jgi:hypothetical protein
MPKRLIKAKPASQRRIDQPVSLDLEIEEKQPALVVAIRGAYIDSVKLNEEPHRKQRGIEANALRVKLSGGWRR